MKGLFAGLISRVALLRSVQAQEDDSPPEKCRNLEFPAAPENSDNGFQDSDKGRKDSGLPS